VRRGNECGRRWFWRNDAQRFHGGRHNLREKAKRQQSSWWARLFDELLFVYLSGARGVNANFLLTAAAPYNVEAIFSFVNHIWDTRGWRSATAKFRNGAPYSLGKHFVPGGLMSIAHQGELYTDYVEHLFIRDNRHERAEIIVQIGDGKAIEAGLARTQRLITGVMEAANVLTLAPRTAA
jgi:hypothetical protein